MAANPVFPVPELTFDIDRSPQEISVRFAGKLTSSTTTLFRAVVREVLPGTRRLVLDLSDVVYMDSAGLGALVGVWVSAKKNGCALKLVNLNQRIKELFRITRLGSVFEGHEDFLGWTPD